MTPRLSLIVLGGAALALSACTDPSRLDPNANYTRDTAIAGGAFGAIAGLAASGGQAKQAVIGAAVGAGAGALIGSQMDAQAAALRQSISNPNITVTQEGDMLRVTMPQDILFAIDSTEVGGALQGDLAALAGNLNQYPDTTAQIVGHTDNTGDAAHNQDLSVRRAQSVSAVLASNGVAASRLSASGQGEDNPVASNLTEEGRARNRRVDILIRPANT
ncbi:OmpA family protein [Aliiruegeria sabulilitoris]|uniref:OmpA family protein n=1 Tax=Aliiruegeria sabulilitoris TaxID=1510458 RepID=UPI0008332527|nr:OmpA family protein [Aliiruegeria sabulilitoris]NDR57339.1 OmpA family protein [Pseudoruegeria sp. M32A2M]